MTSIWMVIYGVKGEAGTMTQKLKYICVHTQIHKYFC